MSDLTVALQIVEDVLGYVGHCPIQDAFEGLGKVRDIISHAIESGAAV